jgi:hypothetical protein
MLQWNFQPGSPEWWKAYVNHELLLDDEGLAGGSELWKCYAAEGRQIQLRNDSAIVIQRFFRGWKNEIRSANRRALQQLRARPFYVGKSVKYIKRVFNCDPDGSDWESGDSGDENDSSDDEVAAMATVLEAGYKSLDSRAYQDFCQRGWA